jgi:hypothetical protein
MYSTSIVAIIVILLYLNFDLIKCVTRIACFHTNAMLNCKTSYIYRLNYGIRLCFEDITKDNEDVQAQGWFSTAL